MQSTVSRRWITALLSFIFLAGVTAGCDFLRADQEDAADALVDELIEDDLAQETQLAEAAAQQDTTINQEDIEAAIAGIVLVDPIDDLIPECARDGQPEPEAGPPWADVTKVEQVAPNEFWIEFNSDLQSVVEGNDGNPQELLNTIDITLMVTFPNGDIVEYRKSWWGHDGGGSEEHHPSGASVELEDRYSPTFVFIDDHTLRIKLLGDEDLPEGVQVRVIVHVSEASGEKPRACDKVGE